MSSIAERRPAGACLPPVPISPVVDDPEVIRAMARANGPYFMPARYLVRSSAAAAASDDETTSQKVPAGLIGPTFRGDWAFGGDVIVDGAEPLLHHPGFMAAAAEMCGSDVIVPEQVFVNLTGPSGGQPFSHVDIPEFVGVDRTNAPGWLLQAMGSSRLFEDARITIITAVAWFHSGERGYFRYWPAGRDADSVRHEAMWNTAVVGDNDFMHHKVERTGSREMAPPAGMTIDTHLDHDGARWCIVDDGVTLATYGDDDIRLSLSWKAKVYDTVEARAAAEAGDGGLTLDIVAERFAEALATEASTAGAPRATGAVVSSVDDLLSDEVRVELSTRWSGYVAG
ncbi:MAG: hypothetical protein ACE367_09205 [Acidimicrobiales bacterium]